MPPAAFELILCLHLDRVVRIRVHQVHLEPAVVRVEIEATIARAFFHFAEDRATGIELHPGAVAEGVCSVKRDKRAEVQMHFAVELEGFSETTVGEFRFVVADKFGGGRVR